MDEVRPLISNPRCYPKAALVDRRVVSYFPHILPATLFLSFLPFFFPSRFSPSLLGFRRCASDGEEERRGGNEREVADLNSTYYSRRRLSDIFPLFFVRGEIRRVIVYN